VTKISSKKLKKQLDENLSDNRQAFLALVNDIRPKLHRYASKMLGSAIDGEDILQDALATAFFKLSSLVNIEKLESWLFSIIHNKSIDHLRKNDHFHKQLDEEIEMYDSQTDLLEVKSEINEAIEIIVTKLPPKERACVVLKDMMGFSLIEIADIVQSTTGGVKSALNRGRRKLSILERDADKKETNLGERKLIEHYLKLFNKQDWVGVQQLLKVDARLEIVGMGESIGRDHIKDNYFVNYSNWKWNWQLDFAIVDGKEMIVHFKQLKNGVWIPHAIVQLKWKNGEVCRIRDYIHVDYLLNYSNVVRQ